MSTSPRRTGLRLATSSAIALSTALATATVVLPAPAFGQALPVIGATGSDGGATITTPGNDLRVNLNDANRIISWETFDVNAGRNVDFITTNTTTPFSVLNRVITNAQSDINGAITSQNNIAVWLVNQTGILFGPNGSFSGGRLVLSTLDLDATFTDANFLAGTGTPRLSGLSTNAITLQSGGGDIATAGSFIAIGQDITIAKTVTATGGDVALIAARDVSFPVGLGSPLSITINQGTTLATAKIDSSGAITGNNVRLVGASHGGAIASLLNVSGGSLTATATDGAVVLATGTVAAQNVTVSSPAAVDGITTAGALNPGAGKDLIINTTGTLAAGGGLTARDLSITAASGVPVTGITATRDLSLNRTGGGLTFDANALVGTPSWGRDISLTATGAVDVSSLLAFTSPGAINITSTTGNIVSNNAAVAALSAGTNINLSAAAGTVTFASLVTGATGQNISITAQDFSLPNINASQDLSITDTLGGFTFNPASFAWGRDVNLTTTNGGSVTVSANLLSPGAARITSAGDIQAASIATTNGVIALTAGGSVLGNPGTMTLNAGGANGDVTVIADQTVDLANVTASNSIAVRSANGNIAGATFDAGEDVAIDGGGTVNVTTLTADDDINVQAAGLVTLGTVSTDGSGPDTRTVNVTGTPITFTNSVANGANISLASTGNNLVLTTSATNLGATSGSITLGAAGGSTIDAKALTSVQGITLNREVSTAGPVVYQAGTEIVGDSITSTAGSIGLTAGTNVRGNTVPGMTLNATAAGSDITATATAGSVNVLSAVADRNVAITSGTSTTIGSASSSTGHIFVAAGTSAALGNLTATGGSIGARAGGVTTGGTLNAAEDIAISVTGAGNTVNLTTLNAGDDIDVSAAGAITVGTASTSAAGPDTRRVDLAAPSIDFITPEPADHEGSSIRLASTGGALNVTSATVANVAQGRDIILQGTTVNAPTLDARRDIAITGLVSVAGALSYTANTGSIKADGITTANGAVSLLAATDITGNTGARMNLAAGGATSDAGIVATAGQAQLGTVTAGRALAIRTGTALDVTSANAFGIAAIVGTTAALGDLTATTSIGVRSVGNMTGGTLDAGVDLALAVTGAGNTVNVTNLRASDDIDVTATGGITVAQALARGTGADTTAIDLTTTPISVVAETADHVGSNIRLTSSGAGVSVTGSATTQGASGADLVLDGATGVTTTGATVTSAKSLAVVARGANSVAAGTFVAGEDISVQAGGTAAITSATAGDDLIVSAGTVRIGAGTSTGLGVDGRRAVFGSPVTFAAGENANAIGKQVVVVGTGEVTVGSLNSAQGNVFLRSATGNVSGLAGGASTGGPLAGFGRADLSSGAVNGQVVVETGGATGIVQLGTVTAGTGAGLATTDQITVSAGTIDLTTGNARDGRASLTALTGDIGIAGSLTGRGDVTFNTPANVRIADHVAGVTGFVRSTEGNVSITAARSVIGYAGSNTMTTATGIDGLESDGAINLTGGDVRIDSITAAGNVGINITGSLTGTAPVGGERGPGLTGGAVFANVGTVGIDAGNAAPDLVRLNRVEAGGNVTIDATNIAIGTLRTPGVATLTNPGGNSYIGLRSSPGDLTLAFGAGLANVNASSLATTDVIETGFGKTAVTSNGGAITATIGDNAQLSTVTAANNVAITTQGLTATGLILSNTGSVSLTASQGTLQTAAVTAGTTAALTKQAGLLANQALGDEMRLTGAVTAAGDATVLSNTHARIASVTSTGGDVSTTATLGDVSGLAIAPATDGRLLTGFDRANLTASTADRTVTATAAAGTAQLGTVAAGTGVGTLAANQITVGARAIDITSATAANGHLGVVSTVGEARLGTGSAGSNAVVTGQTNTRIGSLTARTGIIDVDAVSGEVSGLARTTPATDGRLLTGFDRADLTVQAQLRGIFVDAGGTVQLGTVVAGTAAAPVAGNQIVVNAAAADITSITANVGALRLAVGAGEAIVGTGIGNSGLDVSAGANIRAGSLTARSGAAAVASTNGDVTGLALVPGAVPAPSGLVAPLSPSFGAANVTATDGSTSITANNGIAQIGSATASLNVGVAARALSVATGTAVGGTLTLNATAGSLVLGTGTVGGSATLTKTGATGEVDVTNLSTGNFNGSTGAATITSATNIRADSITARGANITLTAADGEVTGRGVGGRAVLTATLGKDGAGVDIAGSDRNVFVTSGRLSRLGAITAGDAITVQTGDSLVAARDGAIDGTTFTAARGDITLSAFNDAATANGVTATSAAAGGSALLRTTGSTGGSIDVDSVTAASNVLLDTSGSATSNVLVDTATSTGASVAVRSTGLVTGTTYSASADIGVLAAGTLTLGTANAGDDIALTGASVSLGAANARGDGITNSSVNLGLLPASPFVASAADSADLTIASTAGAVNVAGDLSAQRNISVTSVGGATTLAGNLAAGAAPIQGNLTINSGGALTLGAADPRTIRATGAVSLTAAGTIGQNAGALTIQSNSDQAGTEALTVTATAPANIALGNTAFVGGSVANRESIVNLSATGGTVTFGTADAQAFIVRAGGQVTGGAIVAGNAARAADPVATFRTIDIATTAGGGISLTNATAIGTGHDIMLSSTGSGGVITANALKAQRNVTVSPGISSNINITSAEATDGALSISGVGQVRLGTGIAGTTASVIGDFLSQVTTLTTGGALTVESLMGPATLGTGVAGGSGTVRSVNNSASVTSLTAVGTATLSAGTAATAGTLNSSGASVTGTGVTVNVGTAQAATALTLNATGGNLTLTQGTAGTTASVQSTAAATVGTVTAGGNATVRGATGASATTVTSTAGIVLVEATAGAAALGTGTAGTFGVVRGTTSASATSLTAGNGLLVNASAGNASLGTGVANNGTGTVSGTGIASVTSLTATGTATLTAGTAATAGTIRSTGADVVITGGTATIGTAEASTALSATASAGDLTIDRGIAGTTGLLRTSGGNGDVIVTTSLETGGAATVETVGDARLALVRAATGDVTVTAPNGEVTGVDPATATNLTATAGAVIVNNSLVSRLGTVAGNGVTVASGTIVAGDVNAGTGALSLTANNGPIALTTGTAGTSALVQASGAATVGTLTAGTDATIRGATADVTTATATAGNLLVEATAGNAALGTGIAGGTGTVQASGAASATSLTSAGTARITAGTTASSPFVRSTGANVVISGATTNLGTVIAATSMDLGASGGNLSLTEGTAGTSALLNGAAGVTVGTLTAGTDATINGASVNATTATATAGNLLIEATAGNAALGTGTAGGTGTVQASGAANVTSLTSGGLATLTAGTAATGGTIRSTGAGVVASGGTVNLTTAQAATSLSATANNGNLTIDRGIAGTTGLLRTTGGNGDVIVTTSLETGGAATVETVGDARLALVRGSSVTVTAPNGEVTGVDPATATNLTATASAVNVTNGLVSRLGTIAGNSVTVASGTIVAGDVNAGTGALSLTANNGPIALTTGTAGTTALVQASGAATVGTLTAGTDATIRGATADVTTAAATAGNLLVEATAGNAALGTGTAGGTGTVRATGAAGLTSLIAAGPATLTAGTTATAGTIRSTGADVFVTGTTSTVGTAEAAASLEMVATNGDLTLDRGIAGTTGLLRTTGGNGDVIVTTSLLTGGAATVETVGDARLALVRGSSVTVTAPNGEVTGIGTAGANLTATAGAVNVTNGLVSRLGTIAGNGVTVASGTIVAGDVNAGTGALSLTATAGAVNVTNGLVSRLGTIAGNGVTVASGTIVAGDVNAGTGALSLTANNGPIALTTGTAGTTALVQASGAATVGALTAGADATIRGVTADVTTATAAAGALLVEATAGAANLATGVAGTDATVRGTTAANANSLTAGGALLVEATGGTVSLGTGTAGTTGTVRGTAAADATNLTTGGALLVDATAGNAALGAGQAGGTGTVRASGTVGIGSLTAAGTATLTAGAAGTATTIRSTGADLVATGASLDLGTADARTTLAATASNGALTLGTGTAGAAGTLRTTGGGAGGDVTVTTSLTTGGAATITSVSDARLASVTAATGNVTVTATSGEVTGVGTGNANLVATAGAVNVEGGTLARLGTVGAAGTTGVTVTADTIAATNVNAGTGALSLVADTGNVTLGTGRSGTTSLIDARQTATISTSLTAGTSARINAANAEIGGPVAATTRIDVVNTGTGNPFVLGTATGTGFALSETEINRLNAPELSLDARSNNVAIGALSFDGDTGGNRVDVLGLGRIDITGTVAAPGGATTRVIRFGGSATASDKASVIRVAATASGGGGRLLMPNAALELRGVKIGVGQDGRFLESLGLAPGGAPLSVQQVGVDFIGNPQSTLYYAGNFGGAPYNPIGQTLVSANSLTVRTTDYALFQNTGTVGQTTGVVIDARTTNPRVPALTVSGPNPPDAGGFAIFGTFNGFEGSAAALLGATDISVTAVDGTRTRINGCIVGSGGGGCLSNSIVQPVVNVFDSSRSDVLKTSSDFEAPFDPVVGTNNESLFGDVGTFGLEDIPLTSESEPATEECGGPDKAPCAGNANANEGQK